MTEEEWNELGKNADNINHPVHYGGEDNPYEAIKIIDAYGWGYEFALGNAIKYILRAGKKTQSPSDEDLKKASWYLNHALKILNK